MKVIISLVIVAIFSPGVIGDILKIAHIYIMLFIVAKTNKQTFIINTCIQYLTQTNYKTYRVGVLISNEWKYRLIVVTFTS